MYKPLKIFKGLFGHKGYAEREEAPAQSANTYHSEMLKEYVGKKITVSRNNLGTLKKETATLMFEPNKDFFYIGDFDSGGRAAHYHIVHWDYTQQGRSENNRDYVISIINEAGEEIYNRLEWKNSRREKPCPMTTRVVKNIRETRKLARSSPQPEMS